MAFFITGEGRLVRKPELTNGANGPMAKFTMAFSNNDKEKTTSFVNCVLFGKRAETLERNAGQGTRLFIIGKGTYLPYTNKEGVEKYSLNIYIQDFEFISNFGSNQNGNAAQDGNAASQGEINPFEQQPAQQATPAQPAQAQPSATEVSESDLSDLFD